MWRKILTVGLVLGLSGLLVVPAFAAAPPGARSIHCEGNGVAYLHGNGTVEVTSHRGFLGYRDVAGDAEIEIEGTGHWWRLPRGVTIWYGLDGAARISGSRIFVGLKGREIVLDAEGIGRIHVAGEGFCRSGSREMVWTREAQVVELTPTE